MLLPSSLVLRKALIALHVTAGIYAGACLSIAIVDLRFLSSHSDLEKIFEIFSALLGNMGQLMVPQLILLFFLCSLFSAKALSLKRPLITHLPFAIYLVVLSITVVVHIPINLEVFSGSLLSERLPEVIARWEFWHWVRTASSLVLPATVFRFYRPLTK